MPVTPFHFGPGAALHAVAPRHLSFLAFFAANVLIDIESLHNLLLQREPVHAFFHTYLGATLVVLAMVIAFVALRRGTRRWAWVNLFGWRDLTLLQVTLGAATGAYSHVLLDSVMHGDIQPLAPFASGNSLLRLVSLGDLHLICVGLGLFGLVVLAGRKLFSSRQR